MQPLPNPVQPRSAGGGALAVVVCGLATSALTLVGVYALNAAAPDFQIMSWYLDYVIPMGAIIVGIAASCGYGLGIWLKGVRVSRAILLGIVALQVGVYFLAQYLEFLALGYAYEDGTPVDFLTYFHWATTSFAWIQDDGSPGAPLGALGYGLRALELIGFSAGSLAGPAMLRSKAYCEACSRYMQTRRRVVLPASISAKRVKKKDALGRAMYERAQREALDAALARTQALCEQARAGHAAEFRAVLEDPSIDVKSANALPVRIGVELSGCPSCEAGLMALTMYSGQGQTQKTERMGQVELRPHFVREVSS